MSANDKRDNAIRASYAAGTSARALAAEHGLSVSRVGHIVNPGTQPKPSTADAIRREEVFAALDAIPNAAQFGDEKLALRAGTNRNVVKSWRLHRSGT